MKFALVDGEKVEATKGTKGICQFCGSDLTAKCGEVKTHHWAHKSNINCDSWWEKEGEWHRVWKNEFPVEWQEVVHRGKDGEKHIADVKTKNGWVLEFQYSYLKPEERRARNIFYDKLIWIVNGTRRPTDIIQVQKILNEGSVIIIDNPITIKLHYPDDCRLFKEWGDSENIVLFDFIEGAKGEQDRLCFLYPRMASGNMYLSFIKFKEFVEMSNGDGFEKLFRDVILPMHKEILPLYEKNQRYRR
jgi:hypothetical protein